MSEADGIENSVFDWKTRAIEQAKMRLGREQAEVESVRAAQTKEVFDDLAKRLAAWGIPADRETFTLVEPSHPPYGARVTVDGLKLGTSNVFHDGLIVFHEAFREDDEQTPFTPCSDYHAFGKALIAIQEREKEHGNPTV